MELKSFHRTDNSKGISTSVILETPFSKEIQINIKAGNTMKDHKAPFPIIVHLLSGKINFGVNNKEYKLEEGSILSLEKEMMHYLHALEDSMVRLTLWKSDTAGRVDAAAKKSE